MVQIKIQRKLVFLCLKFKEIKSQVLKLGFLHYITKPLAVLYSLA